MAVPPAPVWFPGQRPLALIPYQSRWSLMIRMIMKWSRGLYTISCHLSYSWGKPRKKNQLHNRLMTGLKGSPLKILIITAWLFSSVLWHVHTVTTIDERSWHLSNRIINLSDYTTIGSNFNFRHPLENLATWLAGNVYEYKGINLVKKKELYL